jgi:KDO2-lipid IV(A) lauroyltransferase
MARVDAAFLSSGFRLLRFLSPANAQRLAAGLFGLLGPLGMNSAKVRNNLRIAFPDSSDAELEQLIRATYRHAGTAAAELAHGGTLHNELSTRLEVVTADPDIELPSPGKPAIMVTAHVGAWQYAAMLGPALGIPFTILYAPEFNPHVRKTFFDLRQAFGCQWISRDNSMRPLMKELAAGHSIGLANDTRFDHGRLLPFFGRDAATNTVPARLALRFNCPLIALRCDRLPNQRYRLVLSRQIMADRRCEDQDQQVLRMTAELNNEFETWIRNTPGEWLCMKRRWPREPEASEQHTDN